MKLDSVEKFIWDLHSEYNKVAEKAKRQTRLIEHQEIEKLEGVQQVALQIELDIVKESLLFFNNSWAHAIVSEEEFKPTAYLAYFCQGGETDVTANVCFSLESLKDSLLGFILRAAPFVDPVDCEFRTTPHNSEILSNLKNNVEDFNLGQSYALFIKDVEIGGVSILEQKNLAPCEANRPKPPEPVWFCQENDDEPFKTVEEPFDACEKIKRRKQPVLGVLKDNPIREMMREGSFEPHTAEHAVFLKSSLPTVSFNGPICEVESSEPLRLESLNASQTLRDVIRVQIDLIAEVYRDYDKKLIKEAAHAVIAKRLGFLDFESLSQFAVPVASLEPFSPTRISANQVSQLKNLISAFLNELKQGSDDECLELYPNGCTLKVDSGDVFTFRGEPPVFSTALSKTTTNHLLAKTYAPQSYMGPFHRLLNETGQRIQTDLYDLTQDLNILFRDMSLFRDNQTVSFMDSKHCIQMYPPGHSSLENIVVSCHRVIKGQFVYVDLPLKSKLLIRSNPLNSYLLYDHKDLLRSGILFDSSLVTTEISSMKVNLGVREGRVVFANGSFSNEHLANPKFAKTGKKKITIEKGRLDLHLPPLDLTTWQEASKLMGFELTVSENPTIEESGFSYLLTL